MCVFLQLNELHREEMRGCSPKYRKLVRMGRWMRQTKRRRIMHQQQQQMDEEEEEEEE